MRFINNDNLICQVNAKGFSCSPLKQKVVWQYYQLKNMAEVRYRPLTQVHSNSLQLGEWLSVTRNMGRCARGAQQWRDPQCLLVRPSIRIYSFCIKLLCVTHKDLISKAGHTRIVVGWREIRTSFFFIFCGRSDNQHSSYKCRVYYSDRRVFLDNFHPDRHASLVFHH